MAWFRLRQPERHLRWLHRLVDNRHYMLAEVIEINLIAQRGAEGR